MNETKNNRRYIMFIAELYASKVVEVLINRGYHVLQYIYIYIPYDCFTILYYYRPCRRLQGVRTYRLIPNVHDDDQFRSSN